LGIRQPRKTERKERMKENATRERKRKKEKERERKKKDKKVIAE